MGIYEILDTELGFIGAMFIVGVFFVVLEWVATIIDRRGKP